MIRRAIGLAAALACTQAGAVSYQLIDLGSLNGGIYPLSGSEATGINARGQISVDYGHLSKVYTPGSGFANVGTPTGAVVTAGINAAATVVGSLDFQSFVARAGRPAELREIGSYGLALTDAGAVAGALSRGGSVTRPTLWSATGVARDLGAGRPLLMLQDSARLTATYGVTVGMTGSLSGNGSVAGAVRNLGTITAAQLRLDGGLINRSLVNGSGRLDTDLLNDSEGQLPLGAGEAMVLSGSTHTNQGRIELRGGELEVNGTLKHEAGARLLLERGATARFNDGLHTAGCIDVGFGAVEQLAGAQTVVSGTASITFHDAVTLGTGAEPRVSAGSTALFFGAVNERSGALLTGTGTKFFEGGLSVGDSPGVVVDAGSVSLGTGNVYPAELGGVTTGSEFDHLTVGGELHFGSTLKLVSWAGFKPTAGQRFDLFDWGSHSGQFAQIDASDLLGPGRALDTSRLHLDGSIGVSAVPEPHQALLLAAGPLAIAGKRRLLPQR